MDANNGQRVGGRGRGRGQRREGEPSLMRAISNEIRAKLVDHVINHGLTERGWTESLAQLESIYSGVHNSNLQK